MRTLALCLLTALSVTAQAASELDALKGEVDKALYCFQTNTLRMQLQGALATEATERSAMIQSAERWQTVVGKLVSDPVAQRSALQRTSTRLSEQMQTAGRDPQNILDQVVTPIMNECDDLLAQLDPATQQPATSTAPAAVPVQNTAFNGDVFDRLLRRPLRGKFRWNPHSSIYASTRTEGTFARAKDAPANFQLKLDSKITTLCVGELVESSRSEDGYLMHLLIKPGTGSGCEPQVTRGLLFPMAQDDQRSNRWLMLRLYDDLGRLITASRFKSTALENLPIDQNRLMAMDETVRLMDSNNDNSRLNAKLKNLTKNPDFPRLQPFYNSCMSEAPSIFGVVEPSYYCVCMTYKFGVDGRIPEQEFTSYIQDFSRLTDRFQLYTDDNKLYTRLNDTCQSCSNPAGALAAYCDESDSNLQVPQNFKEMIVQLDKPVVKLETSEFYKENFFIVYLQGYSDDCSDHIKDSVPFDFVVTEYTTDPYAGTFSNEIQRDRTYVARKYAKRYQDIYDKHSKLSPENFMSAIQQMAIKSEADLRRSQSDLNARISSEMEKRVAVREHLAQDCNSSSVKQVYSNLETLFQ